MGDHSLIKLSKGVKRIDLSKLNLIKSINGYFRIEAILRTVALSYKFCMVVCDQYVSNMATTVVAILLTYWSNATIQNLYGVATMQCMATIQIYPLIPITIRNERQSGYYSQFPL